MLDTTYLNFNAMFTVLDTMDALIAIFVESAFHSIVLTPRKVELTGACEEAWSVV